MSYFFYILRCSDRSLYCGITTDLKRRLKEHNSRGKLAAKYTRSRTPVQLVYAEHLENRKLAMKREYEVRHWNKTKKETLITDFSYT